MHWDCHIRRRCASQRITGGDGSLIDSGPATPYLKRRFFSESTRMLNSLAKKLFGSANDRLVTSLQREVHAINALEPEIAALSDDALREKTAEFQARLANGAKLDSLLVEAFAVVP